MTARVVWLPNPELQSPTYIAKFWMVEYPLGIGSKKPTPATNRSAENVVFQDRPMNSPSSAVRVNTNMEMKISRIVTKIRVPALKVLKTVAVSAPPSWMVCAPQAMPGTLHAMASPKILTSSSRTAMSYSPVGMRKSSGFVSDI